VLIEAAEGVGPLLHARAEMLQALRGQNGMAYDFSKPRTAAKKWGRRR
jgi:hypothetical protein